MRPSLISLGAELKQWLNVATPLARDIVRSVMKEHTGGIHVHDIFQKTQALTLSEEQLEAQQLLHTRLLRRVEQQPVSAPPNPLHPIRSLSYLKRVVIPDLETRGEIVQTHIKRLATEEELANRPKPPSKRQRKRRGAVGPGKRPPQIVNGRVYEWVWRPTTEEERETVRADERAWRRQLDKIKALEMAEKEAMETLCSEPLPPKHRRLLNNPETGGGGSSSRGLNFLKASQQNDPWKKIKDERRWEARTEKSH